ncbi:MAG: hypothetical protein HC883_00255 [Bdellovibrionaceae bacterium]|nr:hypothetical protein [Pseudobdellovibrionaceae bacterium]
MEPEFNLGKLPKISESEIGDGLNGNIQTIQLMKKIARLRARDPLLRKLALNIVAQYGVPSHHFIDEALAIGDYVRRKSDTFVIPTTWNIFKILSTWSSTFKTTRPKATVMIWLCSAPLCC